jgi:hypothetical protein
MADEYSQEFKSRVFNCEIHFPDWAPPLFKDLISNILKPSENSRLSLDEIKNHSALFEEVPSPF